VDFNSKYELQNISLILIENIKKNIGISQVSDHKRQMIARELEQCLVEWGIVGMLTISVDNATANDIVVEWFKKRDMANNEVICLHKFIHVRCCAHVINLIVHNGSNDVDD